MGTKESCEKAAAQAKAAPDKVKAAIHDTVQQVTGESTKGMINRGSNLNDPNSVYTYWSTADENIFLSHYYSSEKDKLYRSAKNDSLELSKSVDLNRKGDLKAMKYNIFGNPENCSKLECPTQIGKELIEGKLSKYTKNLHKNFSGNAEDIKKNAKEQHKNYIDELMTLVTQYKSQESYSRRMQDLLLSKKKERDSLKANSVNTNVDSRKAVYEIAEKDKLKTSRKIMFYIYYISFVVYLIFGNYFKDKKYRSIKVWIMMTVYLTLPLYLHYVTVGILNLYDKVLYIKDNKLPKNVYTGLLDN